MTDRVYLVKAAFLKALSHPLRLQIMELLCRGEQSVGQCTRVFKVDQPTISRHLGILKQGGFVEARQKGVSVVYKIRNSGIVNFLGQFGTFETQTAGRSGAVKGC